jgi:hypothetical protein
MALGPLRQSHQGLRGVDNILIRTYQERDFGCAFIRGRQRSEGRPRARETMAPLATSLVERRGGAAPLRYWGARASLGARRTALGPSRCPAGHLAPPGAPSPRFEGDGKGEGRARQPEKVKWPGGEARARRSSHSERLSRRSSRASEGGKQTTAALRIFFVCDWVYATGNSKLAKRTHLSLAEDAQTRMLIGVSGKIAFCGVVRNYQNMKILADRN